MISDQLREHYNIPQMLALPTFILDCEYDEDNDEEKAAFRAAFENILVLARLKQPYYLQGATAVSLIIANYE
jgi:hypothetical protein